MAKRNIELYEALKEPVGEEAARMIAEVVPAADDLATKADIAGTKLEIADLRREFAEFKADIHSEFSSFKGWMFAAMAPLWLGVYGTLVTLLVFVLRG